MNTFRMEILKERADKIRPDLTKARKTIEEAEREGRDLTDAEKAFTEPVIKSAREIADGMAKVREDDAMMTAINEAVGGVTGPIGGGDMGGSLSSSKSSRLSFRGMGSHVARQMLPDGMKALAPSGATVVGQEMKPDPVALGQPALSLLDVITVVPHAQTEFSFMRQTTRTNLAAVVPENTAKPTSVYTVTKIANSLVVIAHLSEGIPHYWLLDQVSLETFVSSELEYGLRLAVEAKVLADVNGTSGTQIGEDHRRVRPRSDFPPSSITLTPARGPLLFTDEG